MKFKTFIQISLDKMKLNLGNKSYWLLIYAAFTLPLMLIYGSIYYEFQNQYFVMIMMYVIMNMKIYILEKSGVEKTFEYYFIYDLPRKKYFNRFMLYQELILNLSLLWFVLMVLIIYLITGNLHFDLLFFFFIMVFTEIHYSLSNQNKYLKLFINAVVSTIAISFLYFTTNEWFLLIGQLGIIFICIKMIDKIKIFPRNIKTKQLREYTNVENNIIMKHPMLYLSLSLLKKKIVIKYILMVVIFILLLFIKNEDMLRAIVDILCFIVITQFLGKDYYSANYNRLLIDDLRFLIQNNKLYQELYKYKATNLMVKWSYLTLVLIMVSYLLQQTYPVLIILSFWGVIMVVTLLKTLSFLKLPWYYKINIIILMNTLELIVYLLLVFGHKIVNFNFQITIMIMTIFLVIICFIYQKYFEIKVIKSIMLEQKYSNGESALN